MILHWLILFMSLLFINIYADINKAQHLILTIAEHNKPNDSPEQPSKSTSEKILIRVPRMDNFLEELTGNVRQRREVTDVEEIWGMAKKVAITVFVLISVCIICCIVITILLCIKCCCGGNTNRKRNQGFNTIPQPIVIHTNSPPYQPQYYQQQVPSSPPPPPAAAAQPWHLENYPMLPQPSAPPQPNDESYMDRPPPYEKICAT